MDIIYRPVFYLEHDVPKTGLFLCLQVGLTEDGDRILSPTRRVLNKR
jgi:hypothetical protein